jgi:hypothetical protein
MDYICIVNKKQRAMKKITKSTLKAFINRAGEALVVREISDINPYTDCVETNPDSKFKKPTRTADNLDYTLGIGEVWVTKSTSYRLWKGDGYIGIYWFNCCGSGIVAVENSSVNSHVINLLR